MGYARYDTPMGPAGYAVEDVCHEDGCSAEIDRGLGYLCGSEPGRPDEHGCGKWFCEEHLYIPPAEVKSSGGGLCGACILKYDGVDDEDAD
jgi:hypothetical protein